MLFIYLKKSLKVKFLLLLKKLFIVFFNQKNRKLSSFDFLILYLIFI